MSDASLTARLAAILARPVEAETRARAALHVLDWVGCAVLGGQSEAGRAIREGLRGLGGTPAGGTAEFGPAHAIGLGPTGLLPAVLMNGALGNILEMDDVHRTSILHPGPVVVPAALALAEARGATAEDFLAAVVRGYEAVIRIGRSVGPGHYKFFHNTATCGPFGAAAAAASLMGLSESQTVDALGNGGTATGGFWQLRLDRPNMAKQVHNARAAEAGVLAAVLAHKGVTGPAQILEGPLGLYAATAPDADPAAVTCAPDGPWLIADTSFKPWPACRHAHATIDAALAVRRQLQAAGIGPAAITAVQVESYRDALVFCDRPTPKTVGDAKFSLQHAAAVTLLDGPPPLSAFEPPAFRDDARIAALRARVSVAAAEPYVSAFPERYGASVRADAGGRRFEASVPTALGDPENPIDAAQVEAKARALLAAAGLSPGAVDRLVAAALALADGGTVNALAEALPPG
jgi:2-methylcitrate dehydratase PrpD